MNIKALRHYLTQKTKEELIVEIADLFSKFNLVKNYYQEKSGACESAKILEKYKALVAHEFFPARGYGKARLSVAKKAITDFKKISQSQKDLMDLMLHYVEMGVRFTNEYGDIDEPFYSSIESMYNNALKMMTKEGLKQLFQPRCHTIVSATRGIGWGFHDTLADMYQDTFE